MSWLLLLRIGSAYYRGLAYMLAMIGETLYAICGHRPRSPPERQTVTDIRDRHRVAGDWLRRHS
jgi:hypothetical protein